MSYDPFLKPIVNNYLLYRERQRMNERLADQILDMVDVATLCECRRRDREAEYEELRNEMSAKLKAEADLDVRLIEQAKVTQRRAELQAEFGLGRQQ